MVPPVVLALLEGEPAGVLDDLGLRRRAQRPRAQEDEHDEKDGEHPLQQLLVRQLHLVRGLDAVRERDPASAEQSRAEESRAAVRKKQNPQK